MWCLIWICTVCSGWSVWTLRANMSFFITNIYLYNFDPLKYHFYIVKLGFKGYTVFVLFLLKNTDCGYSLEPPRWGGSNEYLQSMFWAEIWKKISDFLSKNFQFLVVKFSIYLNRNVFIMFQHGSIDIHLVFPWKHILWQRMRSIQW